MIKYVHIMEGVFANLIAKAGPYTGPRGGKWADPQHTRAWKPEKPKKKRAKKEEAPKKKRALPGSQLPAGVRRSLKKLGVTKLPEASVPLDVIRVNLKNPHTTAVIQWKDRTGRPQNGYTATFHERNAKDKWSRTIELREKLPAIKRDLKSKLRDAKRGTIEQQGLIIANIVAMTGLRPGSMRSLEGRHGVATMTPDHVKISGSRITISFTGKSGAKNRAAFHSTDVADALAPYVRRGKKRNRMMFKRTALVAARDALPGDMKLKDFRTAIATNAAIDALDRVAKPPKLTGNVRKDKRLLAKVLLEASRSVAKVLNNTASVARNNYVHPQVFRQWAIERAGANPALFDEESE